MEGLDAEISAILKREWAGMQSRKADKRRRREVKSKQTKQNIFRLVAGIDYVVNDEGGQDWIAFTDRNTDHFRHTWIIKQRKKGQLLVFL